MQSVRLGVFAVVIAAGLGLSCGSDPDPSPGPTGTCEPGTTVACYTGPAGTDGVGICHAGVQTCGQDRVPEGPCRDEQAPADETCGADEGDEDCDGEVNEEGADCICGDGYLSAGEGCDDGNLDPTDQCDAACEPRGCGDGSLQQELGETCDDGGTSDGDRCSPTCQVQEVLLVSAGGHHGCALLSGGRLKCWGRADSGQLGLGSSEDRGAQPEDMGANLPEVDLGAGKLAIDVAVGYAHTCAALVDGSVKCWGDNERGPLGLGTTGIVGTDPGDMGDNLPAVDLGAVEVAVAVAAGERRSCALFGDGRLKCWGSNDSGSLGLGDEADRGDEPGEMGDNLPAIDLGTGKSALEVTVGQRHTCALLNDGSVKCWGHNVRGQLGLGDASARGDDPGEMGDNLPAVDLGAGQAAATIVAGGDHTCALLIDGRVKCWGLNNVGQLGLGDTADRGNSAGEMGDNLPAVDLGAGAAAVAIAAGATHTCAALIDGRLKCWGASFSGELGLGDTSARGDGPGEMGDNLPAVDLGAGKTAGGVVGSVSVLGQRTCALLNDFSLKCWGFNAFGELGLGDTEGRGNDPGEMGDELPTVKLFSELW